MSSQFTLTPGDKRGLLILVAVIGLLVGMVLLPVSISEVYKLNTAKAPTIPEGFWSEILDGNRKLLANRDTLGFGINEVLVPFGTHLQLGIEFEECKSIRAMWLGYEPNATVEPPADVVVAMDPASHDEWDKYLSGFARSFTPTLNTTLHIGEELLHKSLTLNLSMVISYPVEASKKGYFSNGGGRVEREIKLVPISPAEAAIKLQHETWEKSKDSNHTGVTYFLFFALCYITLRSGTFLYTVYKEHRQRTAPITAEQAEALRDVLERLEKYDKPQS
jgi:hypothetical protein